MVFTAFQARRLHPEEVNPMAGAVSKAMEGFGQGMKAAYMPGNMKQDLMKKEILNKYLPQMQEAEIFGKQFSPLASLATTPMFLNNPRFQAALGELVSRNMHLGSQGQEGGNQGRMNQNTYAGQANLDYKAAEKLAKELSKAGKIKGYISSAGGGAVNYLGDIGKKIIDLLPGKKTQELVNPALAGKTHQFETYINGLKTRALQTQNATPAEIEETFSQHKDENPAQRLARIKTRMPALFEQGEIEQEEQQGQEAAPASDEGTITPENEENDSDNRDLSFAANLSEQIKDKTGHEISPDLIFNYMKATPGKISIPLLLKAAGVR